MIFLIDTMKNYLKSVIGFLICLCFFCVFFFVFTATWKSPEYNIVGSTEEALPDISFVNEAGFYDSSHLTVEIEKNKECEIYYTLNGKVPGDSVEIGRCTKYTDRGIILRDKTNTFSVYGITARPYFSDGTWGDTIVGTYVVGNKAKERFTNMAIFITCDPDKLFGYESGILVTGKLRDDWIKAHPNESPIAISPAGYMQRGREAEKVVNAEFFTSAGQQIINQTVGIRPYGAYSRAYPLKSLKMYARTEYDEINNKLSCQFFGEQYALDGSGRLMTDYKRLVLRSAGSDYNGSHIRDEFHQTLAAMSGFPGAQHVEPVAVFLNGTYYGSMWAHEVISDKWFEDNYGEYAGRMVVASGPEREKPDPRYVEDTIEEDQFYYDDWNNLYDKYKVYDMTDDKQYEEFCSEVDVENYLFYYAINVYINNSDWPYNNHKSYRYYAAEGEEYKEGTIFDGRWRFLVHDMDWMWGSRADVLNNNVLNSSSKKVGKMFKALMKRDECVEMFTKYCLELMNGAFSTENYLSVLNSMHEERLTELEYFTSTSKYSGRSLHLIESSMKENIAFGKERPQTLINDLCRAFKFSGKTYNVNVKSPQNCIVKTGNWEIDKSFQGKYLVEYGVSFTCRVNVGYELSHWLVNGEKVKADELYVDFEKYGQTVNIEACVVEKSDMTLSVYEYSSEGGEDYIVLYNPSKSDAVSTYGYSLSDTSHKLGKYMLPAKMIEAGETVIIYCDNYSGSEKYRQMEVPFNLKDGETIYLSYNGELTEETNIIKLHDGYVARRSSLDNKMYEVLK